MRTVEFVRLSAIHWKCIIKDGNVVISVGHGRTQERAHNAAVENQWREKVGLSIK